MVENKITSAEYLSRINKSLDYIEKNLDRSITLEELANSANFSKFHFHRIFHGVMGETPIKFILRVRIERAASLLCSHPAESITNIAYKIGFSDISVFSRNFKARYKLSPTAYRKQCKQESNMRQIDSNSEQGSDHSSIYFCYESQTLKWRTTMEMNKSIEIRELPDMNVAYIRYVGPYKGDENLFESLWNKLFSWAGPRGLVGHPEMKSLIIYHDDPKVTDDEKLRTSVCITVPTDTKVDGEVGKMEVQGGNYAVARFEVTSEEFEQAWEWVYGKWLPTSGYLPEDRPSFEMYPEEPKDGKFTVDICVPVKPM